MVKHKIMRFLLNENQWMEKRLDMFDVFQIENDFFIVTQNVHDGTEKKIWAAIGKIPDEVKGDITIHAFHQFNNELKENEDMAVASEALSDFIAKTKGDFSFHSSRVGFFFRFHIEKQLSEAEVQECKESLSLFGANGEFHRVLVKWHLQGQWEVMELNSIPEVNDPARQRTREIGEEDIAELRRLLDQNKIEAED